MDLICITDAQCEHQYHTDVLYVQCKTNKYIHPRERAALKEHANKYGGRPVLAYKDAKKHIVTEFLD